jgi:hypothetical protein
MAHCTPWRGSKCRLSMDILASMLAYLGCVAGIVGALALSFTVLISAPGKPANIKHPLAMAAKQSVLKTAAAPQAKPSAPVISTVAQRVALPETPVATAVRQKAEASRTQTLRRQVQEERARRWAYQQDPEFEARFLGYAD